MRRNNLQKSFLDLTLLKTNYKVNRIITKKPDIKKHIQLSERIKNFDGEYVFEEADWGIPVGDEI
jgi:hypothetical protein